MKKIKLIFFMILIYTVSLSEVVFQSSTSNIQMYEPFYLTVEFVNQEKETYKIQGIENFEVVSKSSRNSYNYINGRTTSIKSEVYSLQAKNNGKYRLNLVTESGVEKDVIINVNENKQVSQTIKSKYFIDDGLKKKTYYFGEKIPYNEYFLSFVTLDSFSQLKAPEFNEFSVKDLTNYNRKNYPQEIINYNGRNALKLELYKGILQPNSSGKKQILSSSVRVGEQGRDFFSNNFVNIPRKKTEIEIKPLPTNKPANFKEIVGEIQAEENWSKTSGKVGEAIVLSLKLYGAGNLELLDSLNVEGGENFNIYQNIKDYKEDIKAGKYYNEKSFEIAVIPKVNGTIKTPQFSVSYFNPRTKKYENLVIKPKTLNITGKASNTSTIIQPKVENISTPTINNTVNKNNNSNLVIREVDIKLLKTEKTKSKNIYKLMTGMISIFVLLELLVIIYLIKRKK